MYALPRGMRRLLWRIEAIADRSAGTVDHMAGAILKQAGCLGLSSFRDSLADVSGTAGVAVST